MSVADKLGMGATRELSRNPDGTFTLTVTPPKWAGFDPEYKNSIVLNQDQVTRYYEWLNTQILIQNAFPELSASQREIIQSGIGSDEYFRDQEDSPEDSD
jgi:hypothetical protein